MFRFGHFVRGLVSVNQFRPLKVSMALYIAMLLLFMGTSHYLNVEAAKTGGVDHRLNNGQKKYVKSIKTKLNNVNWTGNEQASGAFGISTAEYQEETYTVWFQMLVTEANEVEVELGWVNSDATQMGTQTKDIAEFNPANPKDWKMTPLGNGTVKFEYGNVSKTLDWNDDEGWVGDGAPDFDWNDNNMLIDIALQIEYYGSNPNGILPGTVNNPFEYAPTIYETNTTNVTITQWVKNSSSDPSFNWTKTDDHKIKMWKD